MNKTIKPEKADPSTFSKSMDEPQIMHADILEILASFHVDPEKGLTLILVETQRKAVGFNEVIEKKKNPFKNFLKKFWGLSAWMLEGILILSLILGKYADFAMVSILLVMNAVMSLIQERRSNNAVQALRDKLHVDARVLRNAEWSLIPARELVPGDIVRTRQGDIIPADIKILQGYSLVDQSVLTGESAEIPKHAGDVLSAGSLVRRGESSGIVILTGADTYFGKTTELVQKARPKLHIEAVIANVVRWLFIIVGIMMGLVIIGMLVRSSPLVENIPLLLVLLMIAVPVALPVVFTVSMAVGARELSKHGVIVTRLSASEDAATMDVLCVDKTGTITLNKLTLADVLPLGGISETDVLIAGASASQEANQDPIDLALLAHAEEKHVFDGIGAMKPLSFIPFDAQNRHTEAVVSQGEDTWRFMKGALTTITDICGLDAAQSEALEMQADISARKGYRTLAVARARNEEPPILLGLVTFVDPIRPEAKNIIAKLRSLGISVKMLTGDALAIASEIGQNIGLDAIRKISDLKATVDPNDKLADASDGFAEIYPEDKYNVVLSLQAAGHVTGMTGDGVNDAPALRQAEVGIAVSSATDIAKSSASVVLIEPGLASIVDLVEQGRMIYQRILTWVINKISRTILESAFVAIPFIVTGKFAISAFAMILLVFLRDFATVTVATDHVRPSQKPETWNIGRYIASASVVGVAMVVEEFILLYFGWKYFGLSSNDAALYTYSFLTLLYFAALNLLVARERSHWWSSMPSRPLMLAVLSDIFIGTLLTLVGFPGLKALPWLQMFFILGFAGIACLGINDALKVIILRRFMNRSS
ncbi:MAG: plasma-membrane proton-efflux P-type ATPase [Erysipelotrichaceae bacterium]